MCVELSRTGGRAAFPYRFARRLSTDAEGGGRAPNPPARTHTDTHTALPPARDLPAAASNTVRPNAPPHPPPLRRPLAPPPAKPLIGRQAREAGAQEPAARA